MLQIPPLNAGTSLPQMASHDSQAPVATFSNGLCYAQQREL